MAVKRTVHKDEMTASEQTEGLITRYHEIVLMLNYLDLNFEDFSHLFSLLLHEKEKKVIRLNV